MRRKVSELRHFLSLQRPVFYGLSRPDFTHIVESDAAAHYRSLERRFERAVDAVDHARELVNGSFELFTTRTAEATNDLVRRLTFITVMLGVVGAGDRKSRLPPLAWRLKRPWREFGLRAARRVSTSSR